MNGQRRPSGETPKDFVGQTLRWLFESIGATHPIRLGLSLMGGVSLQAIAAILYSSFPSENWLDVLAKLPSYQAVGLIFVLLFIPLLLPSQSVPEPIRIELALLEQLVKLAGLNKAERQLIYLDLLRVASKSGTFTSQIDIEAIKTFREELYHAGRGPRSRAPIDGTTDQSTVVARHE